MLRIFALLVIVMSLGLIFYTMSGKKSQNQQVLQDSNNLASETQTITISNNRFIPSSINISVGSTVVFQNDDSVSHQIASDPHPTHTDYPSLNLEVLEAGEQGKVTFTKKGLFGFHDHLSPSIKAQVVVN